MLLAQVKLAGSDAALAEVDLNFFLEGDEGSERIVDFGCDSARTSRSILPTSIIQGRRSAHQGERWRVERVPPVEDAGILDSSSLVSFISLIPSIRLFDGC